MIDRLNQECKLRRYLRPKKKIESKYDFKKATKQKIHCMDKP